MVNKKPDLLVLVEEAERFYRMEKPEMTPLSTGRTPRSDSIDITTIHTQPFTEGSLPRFPAMPTSTPRQSENKGENKGNLIGFRGGKESQLSIPVPQVNVIPLSEDTNYTDNSNNNNNNNSNTNEAKPVATYALHNYNPFVPQPRLQNYDPSHSTAPSNATASDDDVAPHQQQHTHKRPHTHTKPHTNTSNKKHNTTIPQPLPHPQSHQHPQPYRRHSNSTASEADSLRGMSNTDDVAALIMQIKNNPYVSNIHTSLIPSTTATNTTTTTADTTTSTSIYKDADSTNTSATNTAIPKQISATVAAAHVSPYLTSLKDQSPDLGSTSPDGPFHI